MAKEFIAGISYDNETAQFAVLELQSDGIALHHLEEFQKSGNSEIWFLRPLTDKKNVSGGVITKAALTLDHRVVFLHQLPLDSSLTQPEQNQHVQWELSNYIEHFKPKEYITDIHVLRTQAKEQVLDILSVSVKRSHVFNIQQALDDHKIDLALVETNYFGAHHALLIVHPEVRSKPTALAGISKDRMDVGIITNGRLTKYHYVLTSSADEVVSQLTDHLKANNVSDLYLYGTQVSFELTKSVRASGLNSNLLNPFRKIHVSPSFRGFDKFIGQEHRFASCIGAVLRK